MDKRVLVVLIAVAVALVGVILLARRGERGVQKKREPYPFPALKVHPPKDPNKRATWESPLRRRIDRLEISRGGETIVIKRTKTSDKKNDIGEWEIVSPFKYPANKSKIRSLITRLERLEFWEVLTKNPADFKDLNVDEEHATRLRIFAGDELLADMLIGKTINAKVEDRTQTYTAVRKAGTNVVWKLMGSLSYIFGKDLDQWRKLEIVGRKRDDMALLGFVDADGTYLAATRNPDEKDSAKKYRNWELLASKPHIESLDQIDLGRIASTLSSLRAKKFARDVDPAKAGLDKPSRILVAVYKKKHEQSQEGRPAARKAEKARQRAAGGHKEAARQRPEARGAKQASRQGPATKASTAAEPRKARPARLAAARGTGQTPGQPRPLPERAKELRALIQKLVPEPDPGLEKMVSYVAEKMADPNYEVYVLLLGKEKPKDKTYYVKLANRPEIFLVASYSVKTLKKSTRNLADRTLFRIPPEEVTELVVYHKEGKVHLKKEKGEWKALEPKDLDKDLNRDMVKRVVDMFKARFRARSFADTTDPKETGLGRPSGRVIIKTTKGQTYELLVGKEFKKNQWYVQVKGRKDVYVMGTYPLTQVYKPPKKWRKPKR